MPTGENGTFLWCYCVLGICSVLSYHPLFVVFFFFFSPSQSSLRTSSVVHFVGKHSQTTIGSLKRLKADQDKSMNHTGEPTYFVQLQAGVQAQ